MLHVSLDSCTERIFRSFHEVTSTSTMYMDLDSSRHDIHSFCINKCRTDDSQVTIGYFQDFVVSD